MTEETQSRAERIDLILGRLLALVFGALGLLLLGLGTIGEGSGSLAFVLGGFFVLLSAVMFWLRATLASFLGSITCWFC